MLVRTAFFPVVAAILLSCSPSQTASTPVPVSPISALPARTSLEAPLTASERAWIESTLQSLSLREKVGQMTWIWVLGDYTSTGDSTFAEVMRWVEKDGVGGATMSLGTPGEVAAKLNFMQRRARVPLLASADLEPGLGRLEGGVFTHYLMDAGSATVMPSAMAIAATGREQDAYDAARVIGLEARAVGIHINFAPTVDVNNNPSNPVINTRSFGEDPQRVARLSELFVRGTRSAGVEATAKHFPGHGDTDVDSHVGLPIVAVDAARLDSVELVPFRSAIAANVGLVMTAHIALPVIEGDSSTPATLAPRIITGLLRDSLGFEGIAVTDALTMDGVGKGYGVEESSVLAVKAGADILLKPSDPAKAIAAVVSAVERGEISRARIDSSVRRILELKVRSGAASRPVVSLDSLRYVVGSPEHRAVAEGIAQRAITLLRDRDGLVPLARGRTILVQYMPETELRAGRAMTAEMRKSLGGADRLRVVRINPRTSAAELDSIARGFGVSDALVLAAFVRRIEGEGRVAIPTHISNWFDALAARRPAVVVALGNPYLIRQFPQVSSYMVTYGVGDALERAAARALTGHAAITGTSPVSLPRFFQRGDGLKRRAVAESAGDLALPATGTFAFVDVSVIPMDRQRVLERQTVVVRDGRIVEAGDSRSVRAPQGATIIDGRGKYLTPGLSEMHAHIPGPNAAPTLLPDILMLYVANGITTIRGMLGAPNQLQARERVASGELLGPTILVGAPSINGNSAPTAEAAEKLVREHKAAGYDFLKLHPGIPRPAYDAMVRTAKAVGISYGGHVSDAVGIRHSLQSGQSSVDHLDGYLEDAAGTGRGNLGINGEAVRALGSPDSTRMAELARLTRASRSWAVPTEYLWENFFVATPIDVILAMPEMRHVPLQMREGWGNQKRQMDEGNRRASLTAGETERYIAARRAMLRALAREGNRILMGTDSPQMFNVPGFALSHEVEAMRLAGLTPWQIMESGTRNVAEYVREHIKGDARFGTIAVGNRADLVLLEANPLEDIGNLQRRSGVMVRGRWLPASEIERRLAEIRSRYAN
jgi:beta-N-acetylhexosaminidase